MLKKKNCVAMLLAGGQGSRLYALTSKIAKPAVPFGAKYRIIDFPLSNCTNSNIDTVGVLTQYQPLVLNEYIGNGQPWDLDRTFGGVHVLPPYQAKHHSDWYLGTANAIYQNLEFIKRYDPDYVLVLSGDHIYKMDYARMIEFHREKDADCTIAVREVPWEDASRFGILSTDESLRITDFAEKPKVPKSNLASMGIYVFSAKKLYRYLEEDAADPRSSKDFGKDVIPRMLSEGERMFAHPFRGYWKDVGTIQSLWEANMDLLGDEPAFDLFDKKKKIYSRHPTVTPHYIAPGSTVRNSLIAGGCEIYGTVENSVISSNVIIEAGAVVRDSVVMQNTVVKEHAVLEYCIIDENVSIYEDVRVGLPRAEGGEIAVVGRGVSVPRGSVVPSGAMLEEEVSR